MTAWTRTEPTVSAVQQFPYAGRWQIGDAYDTRWVRSLPDGRWAVITRTAFRQVNDDAPAHAEALSIHSDYAVCTDPGDPYGTELVSNGEQFEQYRTGRFCDADVQAAALDAEPPTDQEWNLVMAAWQVA
jgi:hypothetical protein